jgi:hypothetical protein
MEEPPDSKRILVARVGEVRSDDDQVADFSFSVSHAMTRFTKPSTNIYRGRRRNYLLTLSNVHLRNISTLSHPGFITCEFLQRKLRSLSFLIGTNSKSFSLSQDMLKGVKMSFATQKRFSVVRLANLK